MFNKPIFCAKRQIMAVWHSGNTLASHLWGQRFKPWTLHGKVGSFLSMVGSLQARTWPNVCTGFLCPQIYPSRYDLYNVESDVTLSSRGKSVCPCYWVEWLVLTSERYTSAKMPATICKMRKMLTRTAYWKMCRNILSKLSITLLWTTKAISRQSFVELHMLPWVTSVRYRGGTMLWTLQYNEQTVKLDCPVYLQPKSLGAEHVIICSEPILNLWRFPNVLRSFDLRKFPG